MNDSSTRRDKALALLREAMSTIESDVGVSLDPSALSQVDAAIRRVERAGKEAQALMLAVLSDEPCPAAMFRNWAGRTLVSRAYNSGKLPGSIINRKLMVRPSDFFRWLRSTTGDQTN